MPGKRFVDAWTKTSETSQTPHSLFGKPVKRSLRAVFLLCKLKEARVIVTVRGYGFCPDVISDRFRGAQFPSRK